VSIGLLLGAVVLFFYELIAYSRQRARMPEGLTIAGVPVGGLNQTAALERVLRTYSTPVELHYRDQIILLVPSSVGFRIDAEAMMAAAEQERVGTDFWSGFWDFLWHRSGPAASVPLRAEHSATQLEQALRDIAVRYDQPPVPARPIPGTPDFAPGEPGRVLDIARAAELVRGVLALPTNRRVNLPVVEGVSPRPSIQALRTLLQQNLDVAGFNGLAVFYVQDLRSGEELHFAYYRGEEIPVNPDVAFTAASVIKVGIMVAAYRISDGPLDAETDRWMREMITLSENGPADSIMDKIDRAAGPRQVSDTLRALGLENSYIAAWYRPPPIPVAGVSLSTPANQRLDVNTRPDRLNQTTPSEIGMLLADIYACARGGGALLAAFPGEITPSECSQMLDLLAQNKIGILIEGGVPEGTRVAHKHGWTDSPLDSVGDAGIVYSPGGDYVVSIFLWDDPEMIWDPTSRLFSNLSRAVYNYFNPPTVPQQASEG
jgi:beta-lactamase class A